MGIYLCVLFYLTLSPNYDDISMGGSYNLVPFKGVDGYINHILTHGIFDENGHLTFSVVNLLGNLLLLSPFGFLLPAIDEKFDKAHVVMLLGFFLSTCIELCQFFFLWSRYADVDDVIFNTLSALIGFGLYRLMRPLLPLLNRK